MESMLEDKGAGLKLFVEILDSNLNDETISDAVDATLFTMASNPEMLGQILSSIGQSQAVSVTTQRWLITMLAMLSSEREWIEQIFLTEASRHPYDRNTHQVRFVWIPLATTLELVWDPKTRTSKGDVVRISNQSTKRIISGEYDQFKEVSSVKGSSFKLAFDSTEGAVSWGFRLQIRPKFESYNFQGRENMPHILTHGGLDVILSGLGSDEDDIKIMASRALANMFFVADVQWKKTVVEQGLNPFLNLVSGQVEAAPKAQYIIHYSNIKGCASIRANG